MQQDSMNTSHPALGQHGSPYVEGLPVNTQSPAFSNTEFAGVQTNEQTVARPQLPMSNASSVAVSPSMMSLQHTQITSVAVVGLHGGAGASRLGAYLSSVSNFSVSEVPHNMESSPGEVGNFLRVLVASASDYGSAHSFEAIRRSSAFTVVVAVEDGVPAPRVPHIAKARFKAIAVVAPVVYLPFVSAWRYDSQRPASKKYKKAVGLVVSELQGLEKYAGRGRS